MTSRTKLWALSAGALALSLALAGCGGGGGSSSSPQPPAVTGGGGGGGTTTPTPTALSYATDLNASVATLVTLSGDADAEGSALMMAKGASEKLGVLAAGGNSKTVMTNANAIVMARMMLSDAIDAAEADKEEAEKAKADTEDADAISALDAAIMAAETAIKAAQALLDAEASTAGSLASYVQMVEGADADDPDTAADKAKEVADLIHTALTTTAQIPTPGAIPSPHTTSATVGKLMMGPSDAQGMTWAEIGTGLMDMRIAAGAPSGAATRAVMAMSVAGMTADKLGLTATPGTAEGTEVDTDVVYKGIAGVLFCAGGDCGVEDVEDGVFAADTSKLTGSWYFAPDNSMATYLAGTGAAAGTYTLEDPATYVRFGYWLSVASATDDTTTINRYLSGPVVQSGAVYGIDAGVPAFAGTSASYEGNAVGMSVTWMTDNRGKEVAGSRASGHFDADVSLTMTFGSSPTLKGMISGFRGDGADSSWMVELKESDLASGVLGTAATDGTVGGSATSGSWTATAWGGAESDTTATTNPAARPTGVHGAFNAGFTNGAAAGVYATRKQ